MLLEKERELVANYGRRMSAEGLYPQDKLF